MLALVQVWVALLYPLVFPCSYVFSMSQCHALATSPCRSRASIHVASTLHRRMKPRHTQRALLSLYAARSYDSTATWIAMLPPDDNFIADLAVLPATQFAVLNWGIRLKRSDDGFFRFV